MTSPSNDRPRLRFLACGSVDDGKSTLLGRLLFESSALYEDQRTALLRNAAQHGGQIDYSLLFDGLLAERAQKITEDVAHRFFSTTTRAFIVQDAPGHEEYTRNMATAATRADLAVLLVDARHGILEQTKRHAFIAAMFGVNHFLLAVNKIDLIDYQAARYEEIVATFARVSTELHLHAWDAMPLSALQGDNVVHRSLHTPWYRGPTLLEYLEAFEPPTSPAQSIAYLPIQLVQGAAQYVRVYMGTLAQAPLTRGTTLYAAPSGECSRIDKLWCAGVPVEHADPGSAISFTLTHPIDLRRGDVLSTAPVATTHMLRTNLVVLGSSSLQAGQRVIMRIATAELPAQIAQIHSRIDLATLHPTPASSLATRDLGCVSLETAAPCVCARYDLNHTLGALILIDPITHETLAGGVCIQTAHNQTERHEQTALPTLYVESPDELPGSGPSDERLAALQRLCSKNGIRLIARWLASTSDHT